MLKKVIARGSTIFLLTLWALAGGMPTETGAPAATAGAVSPEPLRVSLEELTAGIDGFVGKRVVVEGTVLHLCSVDRTKMKLEGAGGAVVRVDPVTPGQGFDAGLLKKRVRVLGVVSETRIDAARLDELEKQTAILCHVDRQPCRSAGYIERLRAEGKAGELSAKQIAALREKLKTSGKGYLSVVSIQAEAVEVIP
ncbi:MAG: hypothetical protein KA419_06610 [Acidobacteria bacterium]|nr:hypothetical protein [Acidobacteriota bacterium]